MNKTMIVGLVSLVAGVLAYFGITIDEAAQQTLVEAVSGVAAGVGVIMTAIGSYKSGKDKGASENAKTEQEKA